MHMRDARDSPIDVLIAAARTEFARSLVAKTAHLDAMLKEEAWEEAQRAAHKLRGSAGVYGFAALGSIAAALEELLVRSDGAPDRSTRFRILEVLGDARAEAERASREPP
jgi:HPt (histidine-containing phosphotransfer) domain-containing protein